MVRVFRKLPLHDCFVYYITKHQACIANAEHRDRYTYVSNTLMLIVGQKVIDYQFGKLSVEKNQGRNSKRIFFNEDKFVDITIFCISLCYNIIFFICPIAGHRHPLKRKALAPLTGGTDLNELMRDDDDEAKKVLVTLLYYH